jgi:hypothetical protein
MKWPSRVESIAAAGGLIVFSFMACTAEQTREGRLPEVDIDVDADPGRWPEYEVNWAEVDVGTRDQTVTVPVVRVTKEKRQITVPYIDINPPGASTREERTVTMELDVPHAGYDLTITEVRAAADNLWVIGRLTPADDKAAAKVVTRISDRVIVNAPDDLDVRKVIVGDRPEGVDNQQYRFVDSVSALNIPSEARSLYQRPAQAS